MVAITLGSFFLLAPIVRSLIPATDLPAPFPDHHQDAETLLFVLAFAVLLPAVVLLVPRLADRISAASGEGALSALAAMLATGLTIAALAVRGAGSAAPALAVAAGLWTALAAVILAGASTGRVTIPAALTDRRRWIWWLAAIGALGTALSFSDVASITVPALVVGLLAAALALVLMERVTLPRLGRPAGTVVDGCLLVLLFLAVPNLVIFTPGDPSAAIDTAVINFHQNFFLGPANQVLGGGAMLVDTLSQYGIGSIYFLAALFNLIPIGGGTLGLIEGVLSALMFCGGYVVLRMAGVTRLLAGFSLAVAVAVLVYGLDYALGALLQQGAFRFGLPMAVVVGAAVETRWPRRASAGRALQLLAMAVASIWALEAFAYTLFTILAVIGARVWMLPAGERRGRAIRRCAEVVAAILAAHLVFDLATLIFAGELPRWGWYLDTVREFLTGPVGDLTYDFSRWSPGIALGILYLVSAAALILLFRTRPNVVQREPTMMVAIAGTTAMGVGLFGYLVNRSTDHIIPYISLPAILLAALWISLAFRPWLALGLPIRRAALGGGLLLATLMIAATASSIPERFSQSALAYARPGGASLRAGLDRLWDPPPLNPGAIEGTLLLDRYMPGERHSLVITDADLGVEILTRSSRSSELPLGDPWEDSFGPEEHVRAIATTVETLEPDTRMLVDGAAMNVFRELVADPDRDSITDPIGSAGVVPNGLANVQQWALELIGERYRLRTIARGESDLRVVELVPRQ